MERFSFNIFFKILKALTFIVFMSISTQSFANDIGQLRLECSLFISRSNGAKPVVNIKSQPILLGYSNRSEFNDLQPMFILSRVSPNASFLQRRAVMARLYSSDVGNITVLEIGFFNAQIRYNNSRNTYVSEHPTLAAWQFEPVEIFSFEFESDIGSDDIDVILNDHIGARITGNTNYRKVELNCSTE